MRPAPLQPQKRCNALGFCCVQRAEYILSGHCSEKTDVYAFGSFLLELVSGKSIQELAGHAESKDLIIYDWVSAQELCAP